jgi:archaellum component FlaG (FlaF/FlaG flagellin family)
VSPPHSSARSTTWRLGAGTVLSQTTLNRALLCGQKSVYVSVSCIRSCWKEFIFSTST